MGIEIKVPVLPESVMDATVVKFYVQEGDTVESDAPLIDLETDKIVLEVPAPARGIVTDIQTELGAVVKAGQILALLSDSPAEKTNEKNEQTADEDNKTARPVASPAANKIAIENNIDLSILTGTGKNQRITKQDVLGFIGQHGDPKQGESTTIEKPVAPENKPPAKPAEHRGKESQTQRGQRREPMSRLRQRISGGSVESPCHG
jgi:2-oxoglutarate dehydrogenase E2 component (dihydrolipoamide succinyltransferase)